MSQLAHMFRHRAVLFACHRVRGQMTNDWVATGNTGADVIVLPVDSEGAAGPANKKQRMQSVLSVT